MRKPDAGRGLHPLVTENTLHLWACDEDSASAPLYDLLGAQDLTATGAPPATRGFVGGRRNLNGATQYFSGGTAGADAATLQGEWTATVWLRLSSVFAALGRVLAYSATGETEATNSQVAISITADRQVLAGWEQGAGVDVTATSTAVLRRSLWTMVSLVKSAAGGGAYHLDLAINGRIVQRLIAAGTNATGGSSATWWVGASTSGADLFSGDIGAVLIEGAALTEARLAEDYRRGTLLALPTSVWPRVTIEDQVGDPQDFDELQGEDWVDDLELADGVDQPGKTCTIRLARELGDLSLAPLRTDSRLNLTDPDVLTSWEAFLEVGRAVEVWAARVPYGLEPTSTDWQLRFQGDIDEIDWGGEQVTLQCRDQIAALVDTYIEDEDLWYPTTLGGGGCGSDAGSLRQTMQELLDVYLAPAPTLVERDDPGFCVIPYQQRREPLHEAIRALAALPGFDVKWLFDQDPAHQAYRLTLFDPGRERTDPDVVLAPWDVRDIRRLSVNRSRVRNAIRVVYDDVAVVNSSGQAMRDSELVTDSASITRYGRRFMEVGEAATSQIDTAAEAAVFAQAMLADLKEPEAEKSAALPVLFELETNDLVRFLGNHVHYTGAQQLAAVSVRHRFSRDGDETTIDLRGAPSAGFKRWLQLDVRNGGVPPMRDPGNALLEVSQGDLAPFLAHLLQSDYFAGGKFLSVKNPDFIRRSRGPNYPPDAWTPEAGSTWGTEFTTSATSRTGDVSLSLVAPYNAEILSDFVPLDGSASTPYGIEVLWARGGGGSGDGVDVAVRWYDGAKTFISDSVYTFARGYVADVGGIWYQDRQIGIHPPSGGTARYARLGLARAPEGGATTNVLVDAVAMYRIGRQSRMVFEVGGTIHDEQAWRLVNFESADEADGGLDHGGNFTTATYGAGGNAFLAREPGRYEVTAQVVFRCGAGGAAQYLGRLRLAKNATYDSTGGATFGTQLTGSVLVTGPLAIGYPTAYGGVPHGAVAQLTAVVDLELGDRLTVEGFADFSGGALGGSMEIDPATDYTWAHVKLKLAD